MATIQEMLLVNGGSFAKAEQMALQMIASGGTKVYLDLALLLHAQGKVAGARQAGEQYLKAYPECPRGRLAATWFKLYDGDLDGGLEHFDVSREAGTLISLFQFTKPRWVGESVSGATVVLVAEGGAGDEMLGLRAASFLAKMGAKVVVSCSKDLMPLFARADGAYAVVERETRSAPNAPQVELEPRVHYDKWVPAFSSLRHCKLTWDTLYPGSYIHAGDDKLWARIIPQSSELNVGLRWRGNPMYEHEQFRTFPVELMWDAIRGIKANFYSLQRDDRTHEVPPDVCDLDHLLGNWEQTALAISRLNLVITSDTSIGHLAGAMGVPVWIIVPVMCYWPWAKQGDASPWYPSATLFRQEAFGDWRAPFAKVRDALKELCEP